MNTYGISHTREILDERKWLDEKTLAKVGLGMVCIAILIALTTSAMDKQERQIKEAAQAIEALQAMEVK